VRIPKPSPSMLVACAALVLSATGAAGAAGLISGSQIKNHSIHRIKLASDALPKPGPRGLRGSTGAAGPAGGPGVVGPAGGFDPNKIQYVTGPDTPIATGANPAVLTATCPTGTKVLAGGFFATVGITYVSRQDTVGNSWVVWVDATGGPDGHGSAYAVCGSA
jgi:hypothetical protein